MICTESPQTRRKTSYCRSWLSVSLPVRSRSIGFTNCALVFTVAIIRWFYAASTLTSSGTERRAVCSTGWSSSPDEYEPSPHHRRPSHAAGESQSSRPPDLLKARVSQRLRVSGPREKLDRAALGPLLHANAAGIDTGQSLESWPKTMSAVKERRARLGFLRGSATSVPPFGLRFFASPRVVAVESLELLHVGNRTRAGVGVEEHNVLCRGGECRPFRQARRIGIGILCEVHPVIVNSIRHLQVCGAQCRQAENTQARATQGFEHVHDLRTVGGPFHSSYRKDPRLSADLEHLSDRIIDSAQFPNPA
jgi:hypothetical protein